MNQQSIYIYIYIERERERRRVEIDLLRLDLVAKKLISFGFAPNIRSSLGFCI
jgi:hypothetical protein